MANKNKFVKISPEDFNRNFADIHPPLTANSAVIEASRCLFCFDAPCTIACPTHIDVPKFIKKIATGNLRGSARTVLEANILGIFLTYLVPPTLLFLPLARVVADLGLQNSMWSLVLVYPTFTIPFCTWLLMGFFKALPPEIEEAAIVDGCSLFGAFVKMALPLSLPGILTVVIFTFTLTLQEFVYALTFVSASDQKPITLGVATDLIRGDIFYWGEIMAGALIASIPVAIMYNLFLDRFISGITGGAVK